VSLSAPLCVFLSVSLSQLKSLSLSASVRVCLCLSLSTYAFGGEDFIVAAKIRGAPATGSPAGVRCRLVAVQVLAVVRIARHTGTAGIAAYGQPVKREGQPSGKCGSHAHSCPDSNVRGRKGVRAEGAGGCARVYALCVYGNACALGELCMQTRSKQARESAAVPAVQRNHAPGPPMPFSVPGPANSRPSTDQSCGHTGQRRHGAGNGKGLTVAG
jgi:hypothetical protein